MLAGNQHHGGPSTPSSSSSSIISRTLRFLAISFFLVSVAYHSFAGTRYRKNVSAAAANRDASLRGKLITTDELSFSIFDNDGEEGSVGTVDDTIRAPQYQQRDDTSSSSTASSRYYKSIFYNAYNSLYKIDNQYSRMLSDIETEPHTRESEQEQEELANELSIEVSFEDTYKVLVFLGVVFSCGEIASYFGVPSLVGQMIAGFLLGPPLLEYVPYPESFVLLGDLGLIMLLIEAGIELDVGLVKEAGIRPILIAVAGSVLAFVVGMGIAFGQGQVVKSAIAAGAVFAPTSLGVAANALTTGKALNTPVGQLIVASAVIDDVIGLIILSMLNVLVEENPPIVAYFIPIISAVGYLIVLGISAITWIPHVVQNKILPRFKSEYQQYVALALLYLLVMAYLPMMYYSKASHLTGAFLAGLSFSQVEGVHHTFINECGSIMEWLLRIFFACSIGFQVPIQMFGNSTVVAWGFAFYVAVLAKLPVGFFAPKYNEKLPNDYPFNPFKRDVTIVSTAMTCRGEFSFIIAAFGIGEALLDTEIYSAIIFAVLLSSITSPIALTLVLKHYNRLSAKYLEQEQLDKSIQGGRAPLHLNIQIRSQVVPGMQSSIKNCCNALGLFVIDQRSWQPRGLGVIVATELYAVDSKTMVDVSKSLKRVESIENPPPSSEKVEDHMNEDEVETNGETRVTFTEFKEGVSVVSDPITERCEEIRQALLNHPNLVDGKVKVMQWVPMADVVSKHYSESAAASRDAALVGEVAKALENKETIDRLVDEKPHVRTQRTKTKSEGISFRDAEKLGELDVEPEAQDVIVEPLRPLDEPADAQSEMQQREGVGLRRRSRRTKTVSSPAVGGVDLWSRDSKAQAAAKKGAPSPPVQYDLQSGIRYGVAKRQRMPSDLGAIAENTPTIEERLGGIVRYSLDEQERQKSSFARGSLTNPFN